MTTALMVDAENHSQSGGWQQWHLTGCCKITRFCSSLLVQPDVVLMDIFLPFESGCACVVSLKALLPQTQIVILTAVDEQELVFRALEAGADGYLLKRTKPSDLRAALLDVLRGGAPMTSQIARCVIGSFRQMANFRDKSKCFSLTEGQILMLLCQGYTNSTGTLDGTGAFSNAILINASQPASFFWLRLP